MSILLITHDLGVVAENADVVAVMYASRVVEVAGVEELFDRPQHPYTEGLFRAVPKLGDQRSRLEQIPGTVPNPARFPAGCKFHPRCHRTRMLAQKASGSEIVEVASGDERFHVLKRCVTEEPELREVEPAHWARCHQLPQYERATVTMPKLNHRREVTPEVVEEGDVEQIVKQEVRA
jgi:oligopeptide/dipeptide ABC transporter ATP-binding protein